MAIKHPKVSAGPRSYRPISFYFSNFPQRELGYYAGGFLDAARTLMRSLRRRRGFSNVAVAPVLFMYRHSIELFLKAIIIRGNRSLAATAADDEKLFRQLREHKLLPLLSQVEELFARMAWEWYWPNRFIETFADVRKLLGYLEGIDPDSYAFRYPVNTKGQRAIATNVEIPFEVVVAALDALAEALDTTDFALDAERDN